MQNYEAVLTIGIMLIFVEAGAGVASLIVLEITKHIRLL